MDNVTLEEVEDQARALMEGRVPHEQWMFAFQDWTLDVDSTRLLTNTLHRWNTDAMVSVDEKFLEIIVEDAMDAASIFLTEKPLKEYFAALDVDGWVADFTNSLVKVNI